MQHSVAVWADWLQIVFGICLAFSLMQGFKVMHMNVRTSYRPEFSLEIEFTNDTGKAVNAEANTPRFRVSLVSYGDRGNRGTFGKSIVRFRNNIGEKLSLKRQRKLILLNFRDSALWLFSQFIVTLVTPIFYMAQEFIHDHFFEFFFDEKLHTFYIIRSPTMHDDSFVITFQLVNNNVSAKYLIIISYIQNNCFH